MRQLLTLIENRFGKTDVRGDLIKSVPRVGIDEGQELKQT